MDTVQLTSLVVSALLLGIVLDLVRRKKLTEEYAFVWIVCAVVLIVLSLARRQLDRLAVWFGIFYPPAALLVLILFVFLASVSFSVVVSRQRQQIEKLIEDAALLDAALREATGKITPPGTNPPPDAS